MFYKKQCCNIDVQTLIMDIEKAILQKQPFKNETERLMVNLMFTVNWLSTQQKQFFSEFGLTGKQYNILLILKGAEGPISTAVIRKRMIDKMSDASRIVDRLEKKAFIKKVVSTVDQRKVDVSLTEVGTKTLEKINPKLESFQRDVTCLSTKETILLNELLDKMRE